jgi:hypothetical protein
MVVTDFVGVSAGETVMILSFNRLLFTFTSLDGGVDGIKMLVGGWAMYSSRSSMSPLGVAPWTLEVELMAEIIELSSE